MKIWKTMLRYPILVVCALSLASCGGGGGGGNGGAVPVQSPGPEPTVPQTPVTPPTPTIPDTVAGTLKVDVISIPLEAVSQGALTVQPDGRVEFSGSSSRIAALKVDQTVLFPADASAGRPIAFLGRVVAVSTNSGVTRVSMRQAYVEDVYERLSWDLDTSNEGTRVLGAVGPVGGRLTNVAFTPRQVGALAVGLKGLNGDITYSEPFVFNGMNLTLSVSLKLANVGVRSKAEFDPAKFSGGWGRLGATVSGDVEGEVKITSASGVSLPLGDIFHDSAAWKSLKWNGGKLFSLEGLGDSDKKGLVPIGGLVIAPGLGAVAFKHDQIEDKAVLGALASASATVLWIYMDGSGNVTLNGEAGVRLDKQSFSFGRTFTLRGASFDVTANDKANSTGVHVFGTGKFQANQKLGVRIAADVLVGGIRPLSASAFAGAKYSGEFKGEQVSLQLYPKPGATGTWGCFDSTLWAGVDGDFAMRIKGVFKVTPFGSDILGDVLSGGVSVGYLWHGTAAELFNKTFKAGHKAVCWGDLAPSSLELPLDASNRLRVTEPGTATPIRDTSGGELAMPARLKWTVSDTSLLSLAADDNGALLKARAAGLARVVATDELTGWTSSAIVMVGLGCTTETTTYPESGGGAQVKDDFFCRDAKGNVIVFHQAAYTTDAQGRPVAWGFTTHLNTPSLRTMAVFNTSGGGIQKDAIRPKDPTLPYNNYGEVDWVHGDFTKSTLPTPVTRSYTFHNQYGPNFETISSNIVECTGTQVTQTIEQNGVRQRIENSSLPCPTYADVDAINDIRLVDNPMYINFKKRFP